MSNASWHIDENGQTESSCRIIDDARRFVMRLEGMDYGREEDQGHAFLVAAAPDLLAACKAMLGRMEAESEWLDAAGYSAAWMVERHDSVLTPARAAIAKAEGREA